MITDADELEVGILGAGLTGLTLASALKRKGVSCRIWDGSARAGGAIRSIEKEGFLVEEGPNSMLVKSQRVWEWLLSLGLEGRICEASPRASKRFIVRNGKACAMPAGPLQAIGTPLYSPGAKLRVLQEPWINPATGEDESVASFVRRRLGPEFLDYGISCLVSGIYAGDPEAISIRHAFPRVWNLEQRHGSLIGGALALKRARKRSGIPGFKSRMLSFDHGLKVLVDRLYETLGENVRLGVRFNKLKREPDGHWIVETSQEGVPSRARVKHLVLTMPQHQWAMLPIDDAIQSGGRSLRSWMTGCRPLEYPPLSTLVLGFHRKDVAHPLDGFGMLIPEQERRFILGSIFSSSLFPNRAPEGQVALMQFIGGAMHPDRAMFSVGELVDRTCRDLKELIGVSGNPSFVHHCHWPRSIPQYQVGHQELLDQLAAVELNFPGLHLQGNFRGGPGLSDSMESALGLAGAMSSSNLEM
jgi:oxygen-dependent protoporphyrinogen oxidase